MALPRAGRSSTTTARHMALQGTQLLPRQGQGLLQPAPGTPEPLQDRQKHSGLRTNVISSHQEKDFLHQSAPTRLRKKTNMEKNKGKSKKGYNILCH